MNTLRKTLDGFLNIFRSVKVVYFDIDHAPAIKLMASIVAIKLINLEARLIYSINPKGVDENYRRLIDAIDEKIHEFREPVSNYSFAGRYVTVKDIPAEPLDNAVAIELMQIKGKLVCYKLGRYDFMRSIKEICDPIALYEYHIGMITLGSMSTPPPATLS